MVSKAAAVAGRQAVILGQQVLFDRDRLAFSAVIMMMVVVLMIVIMMVVVTVVMMVFVVVFMFHPIRYNYKSQIKNLISIY